MITDEEEVSRHLSARGHRLTKQRLAVLRAVQSTRSHPDARWIYERVRKEIPKISLGTVYRTLGVLKETGLVQELDYGSSLSHYGGNLKRHQHIVCTNCGRIEDLQITLPSGLVEGVKSSTGFRVTDCRLEFYGLCLRCSQEMMARKGEVK